MNKIRFHYIPAIKDRSIFERLLSNVYVVLSRQEEFNDSLSSFSDELRSKTKELSQGLLGSVRVNSAIAPPTDLTELFCSLDFETQGRHGDKYSLTLQRGDGVQVRHIPEILAFLSDRGGEDYHIWGFEEPENSLELASAIAEANRFLELSQANNKQIFVTSHSPAFFNLHGEGVGKYFVSKVASPRLSRDVSEAQKIRGVSADQLPADLMGETPHLAIISAYLDGAAKKIEALQLEAKALVERVEETATPILFVEGESDKQVLRSAWDLFVGGEHPLVIEACAGTTKMESLSANGHVLRKLAPERSMFVLVDNDGAGRKLRSDRRMREQGGKWVQHNSNKSWWCRLLAPREFIDEMRAVNIEPHSWPATLENVFSREVRLRAMSDGAYTLSDAPFDDLLNAQDYKRISRYVTGNDSEKIYFFAPTPETKDLFSAWLVEQAAVDREILAPLQQIVVDLFGLSHRAEVLA